MTDVHDPRFERLLDFIARIPAVQMNDTASRGFGAGEEPGGWWVKFSLDIDHELAWYAVQELGAVLNSLSLEEGLASVFKPVSPPPYLNGGPEEFLSWVIEGPDELRPDVVAMMLEDRLPQPVEDEAAWFGEPDDEGDFDDDEDDEDGPYASLEDD